MKMEDKYDYSLLKDIRRRECRVDIICPKHGILDKIGNY